RRPLSTRGHPKSPRRLPPPPSPNSALHRALHRPVESWHELFALCEIRGVGYWGQSSARLWILSRTYVSFPLRIRWFYGAVAWRAAMELGGAMAQVAHVRDAAPVPPQNLEAEESVLGAMMLSPGAIGAVSDILVASDFYRESHAKIYRAALDLYAQSEPVDAITLVDALEERSQLEEVGGRPRIQGLASIVPATANAAHYARIVHELATLRGLIRAGGQIAQLGWERPGETSDLVDRAEQIVFDLSQQRVSTEFSHIEALLKESFERI